MNFLRSSKIHEIIFVTGEQIFQTEKLRYLQLQWLLKYRSIFHVSIFSHGLIPYSIIWYKEVSLSNKDYNWKEVILESVQNWSLFQDVSSIAIHRTVFPLGWHLITRKFIFRNVLSIDFTRLKNSVICRNCHSWLLVSTPNIFSKDISCYFLHLEYPFAKTTLE